MKFRNFILAALFILAGASSRGQMRLDSFYGLNLGEKYPEIAVLNALRASGMDRGTPIVKDTLPSFKHLTYLAEGIQIKSSDSNEPVKASALVVMAPDSTFEAVIVNPHLQGVDPIIFFSDNADPDLKHFINANVEKVEDEFFGLKLGSEASLVSITRAVGGSGSYKSSYNEGRTRVHSFTGVTYADTQWDYALFSVTPDGRLVAFTVYSIFEGRMKGYHPSNRLHLKMRDLYFQKYGFGVLYGGEEEEVLNDYVFSGRNGLDHIVSFFETETESGKDAYCVQMEFVHDSLNRNL